MMTIMLWAATAAVCGKPQVLLAPNVKWVSPQDDFVFRHVEDGGCKRQYGAEAPCLVKFIKVGTQSYRVICGKGK